MLQERAGHRFADLTLLYEALTHRSALMELSGAGPQRGATSRRAPILSSSPSLPWNERLEFLGDAVLGLAISQRLMEGGDKLAEGDLSRLRAMLVNEENLADQARQLQLGKFLIMGKGTTQTGGRNRDSLLADALEALIGAVFVDGGFAAADALVGRIFAGQLKGDLAQYKRSDYKTQLQELTQAHNKQTPVYEVAQESGPDHAKVFEVRCLVSGQELGRGRGASKKRASQEAAKLAISSFKQVAKEGQL
ncbi:MAG: ribonuclease [Pseudomonadota bacterium]